MLIAILSWDDSTYHNQFLSWLDGIQRSTIWKQCLLAINRMVKVLYRLYMFFQQPSKWLGNWSVIAKQSNTPTRSALILFWLAYLVAILQGPPAGFFDFLTMPACHYHLQVADRHSVQVGCRGYKRCSNIRVHVDQQPSKCVGTEQIFHLKNKQHNYILKWNEGWWLMGA